jgi:hypothetical protein
MGRAAVPTTEEEIRRLSLKELNAQIAYALWMSENGGTSQGRKAFFDRLGWLGKQREALHGVPAKPRRFRRR